MQKLHIPQVISSFLRLCDELGWLAMRDPDFSEDVDFCWWPQLHFARQIQVDGFRWVLAEIRIPRLAPMITRSAHWLYLSRGARKVYPSCLVALSSPHVSSPPEPHRQCS